MSKQTQVLRTEEALKLALEALESCDEGDWSTGHVIHPSYDEDAVKQAMIAIEEALAQQSVTEPHKRTWAGLTDDDKMAFLAQDFGGNRLDAMDWAEKRLKEKNT